MYAELIGNYKSIRIKSLIDNRLMAIEFSSDVLMGLQYKGIGDTRPKGVTSADFIREQNRKDKREVELVILKNRHGRKDISVYFEFSAMFNHFKDTGSMTSYEKESQRLLQEEEPPIL